MSYYIEGPSNQLISGLYQTQAAAQNGIDRYIASQAKRYTPSKAREEAMRLKQSLKVAHNVDSEPPAITVLMLRDEILKRVENAEPGTIYSRPLLLGMIRTRLMGLNGQYWEVTQSMRDRALSGLFSPTGAHKDGVLVEKDGVITRTDATMPYSQPVAGWLKSYMQRV